MPIQGLAYFPGIQQIVDGSMNFAEGITPSVASLTIAPQNNFTAQVGTLTFFDGVTILNWPDARLDTNSFERNFSGLIWRLSIYDRRWKWTSKGGGGVITLGANLRDDTSNLLTCTEMTPQNLAIKCLEAMGEQNYDVSVLPNNDRPEIMWDGALPAQCLEDLCESLGCRVVLGLDNRVRICTVGEGNNLPETPEIITNSLSLTIPGLPSRIVAVCQPDRFQVDLQLEAVGIENDSKGTLKPIDELSYKPTRGWEGCDIQFYDNIANTKDRNLALRSVFRYYRVKFPINLVPGYIDTRGNYNAKVTYPWQVKLENSLVEYVEEDLDLPELQRRCKPVTVWGTYYEEKDGVAANNTTADIAPYQTDPTKAPDDEDWGADKFTWHLGGEGQLGTTKEHYVVFNKPVYKNGAPNNWDPFEYAPAELYLTISCTLLDEYSFSPVRSFFYRDTGSSLSTNPRYELFSDLQVWHYLSFDGLHTNAAAVQRDANYYIDGLIKEYNATVPQTIQYAGLKYIELDGAIQHIHVKVGKSGCTTTASRNNEQLNKIQPITYRKLMSKLKGIVKGAAANKPTLRSHRGR